MPTTQASELLRRVDEAWRPLRDSADRLGHEGLERTTASGWTAKEMLAHVAFWEESVDGAVRMLFRGETADDWVSGSGYKPDGEWPSDTVHNAREAAWARTKSAGEVLDRWDRAHERMVTFLATVTDAEVAEHGDYFTATIDHYAEHRSELDALPEQP
jgi:hypothetical protein